jgi:hypothetical protein
MIIGKMKVKLIYVVEYIVAVLMIYIFCCLSFFKIIDGWMDGI